MSHNLQRLTSFLSGLAGHGEARSRQALLERVSEVLPTVSLAGRIANEWLCHHLAGLDEAILLDIGPGTGKQGVDLLRRLGSREDRPRHLTIVAVEPDAVSLRAAEHNLLEAAQAYRLDVQVMAFHSLVEELDPAFWALLSSIGGTLLVHSAFALHHLRGTVAGEELRDILLRRLRMLEPKALVLAEPSLDLSGPDPDESFRQAWRHFGLTFQVMDRLALPPEESDAIRRFLVRELEAILNDSDDTGSKRFEHVRAWWRRLARAGFTRGELPPTLDIGSHPHIQPRGYPGYVGLDVSDETLVAVMCATPAARDAR
ncbi:hypothetical protein JY651_39550 [Pyxidicoccus parkwayensis]|uniref:Methyltransferase domain-containing protein n=1 Tax=Pyxidicoccus parkwayensis TaxID=2813578 RepID=A0ABX7NUU2_9BACT|nr:class I SAM-dependent methyltransferase [Pyxidicoccus parkwaysis]QSQ21232.1 hypothetical protein JY651_39550 [Pyxidicoccus parkwaysis]